MTTFSASTTFLYAILWLRARAIEDRAPGGVDGVRVFDAEEIGYLAIVRAIVDDEIGALARLQRSYLATTA